MNVPFVQQQCITKSYQIYGIHNQSNIERNNFNLLVHGNGLMVVCLAPSHFLTDTHQFTVTRVTFDVLPVSAKAAKKKPKQQQQMKKGTVLVTIHYTDVNDLQQPLVEKLVTFCAHMSAAQLIEVNSSLLQQDQVQLVQRSPLSYGYLCILNANHTMKNSQLLHDHLVDKCGLTVEAQVKNSIDIMEI